jgi:uracil-DNA glycosylase
MKTFDPDCVLCPRLDSYLHDVRTRYPTYHARPVPAFGAKSPRLLIVGLAPGLHGANATGRPFTGDHAGIILYRTLHKFGFANQADGVRPDDGLRLRACRITNAVKCVPPENKPTPAEMRMCNAYLRREIAALPTTCVILALGKIAHDAVLLTVGERSSQFKFAHGAKHTLTGGRTLFDSYHCSRYNTQTGRLTTAGFDSVFQSIVDHLDSDPAPKRSSKAVP